MSVLSLGDIVRSEMALKGLPETPANVGKTALSMREEHGEEIVVDRLIPSLMSTLEVSDVLIDGMRQPEEMDRLREHIDEVTVVAMSATPQSRLEWLEDRGRGEDGGGTEFAEREEREWGWGLEMLMEQAHAIILNEGSLEELEERSDMILETLGF
jgi:dephospho-CoA kinase